MKKTLHLTMPGQGLLLPRQFQDISFGSPMICGALSNHGYIVTHHDLDIVLSNYRFNQLPDSATATFISERSWPELLLTETELNTLLSADKIKQCMINPDNIPPRIYSWLMYLLEYTENTFNIYEYDFVSYTVENKTGTVATSPASFSFTLLYNRMLQKKYQNIVTYVGGKYSIDIAARTDLLKNILLIDTAVLPSRIFLGQGLQGFTKYLDDYYDLDKEQKCNTPQKFGYIEPYQDLPAEHVVSFSENFIGPKILPVFPENLKDRNPTSQQIFPKELLDQFPKLQSTPVAKFANYKFSIGCPFRCAYCASRTEGPVSKSDINTIVDTFQHFQNNGINHLRLFDTNINLNKEWTKELCNALIQKNIKIKWSNSGNTQVFDQEMITALKEAGCVKMWWGTESVSPKILKTVEKHIDPEKTQELLELSHNAGIWNCVNIIVNFPYETEEDFHMTIDFLRNNFKKRIINGFWPNTYRLLDQAEQRLNPDKFGIEPLEKMPVQWKWRETNGRSWDEIEADKERKKQYIYAVPELPTHLALLDDDPLFFTMHDAYNGDINKIADAIKFLENFPQEFYDPQGSSGFAYKLYR